MLNKTMTTYRLSKEVIMISGNMMMYDESSKYWFPLNGKRVDLIVYRRLYMFLEDEKISFMNKFNKYVDRVIKEILG